MLYLVHGPAAVAAAAVETSTSTTDRWILTSVASSVGSLCRHTIATSTVCMILILVDQTTDRTRPEWTRGPATVMAEIVEKRGPGDQGTRGPGDRKL